jgi:hypothetical protein
LPTHLERGEQIGALARADSKNETGLFVATDRRLFFLNTESGSYFIKHTGLVAFAYDDVERLAFETDGVVVTPRGATPTASRGRATTRIVFGAVVGAAVGELVPGSVAGAVSFLLGAVVGGAVVVAAQVWTRKQPSAVPEWIARLSGLAPRRSLELKAVPPLEAGALYDYLGGRGGPLEDRILDLADVKTQAVVAAAEPPSGTGQPERWTMALIVLGAALAVASIVAFFAAASVLDLCKGGAQWLWGALLLGPPLSAVVVAVGYWGTRSAAVRNRSWWAWLPVAAAFIFVWLGSTAAC